MTQVLLYLLLISNISLGQQNSKSIHVQGKASVKVRPDIAVLTLALEKSDTSQAKAMSKLNQTITLLSDLLAKHGLNKQQIRIQGYTVNSSYIGDKRKKEYTAANTLTATFSFVEKQIGQLLRSIEAERISDVDIAFDYRLSDSLEKSTKDMLVQKAIANAKSNARNIAEALHVTLKGILQVSKYGPDFPIAEKLEEVRFSSPVIKQDREIKFSSAFHLYEIEEKELTEEISVIFEIG